MTSNRTRVLAAIAVAVVSAGVVTVTGGQSSEPAAAPRHSTAVTPAAPANVGTVEVTLSGVDGTHGPVQATVTSLPTAPAPAAKTAAAPVAAPPVEGITVQSAGKAVTPQGRFRAHSTATTVSLSNGLDLAGNGTSVFTANGMRYVSANFKVRYGQTCSTPGSCATYRTTSHNLTLVAAETATTIDQTAVSRMRLFDGSNANSAIATQIVPTDGVQGNGNNLDGVVHPAPGLESLQVFSEAEVAAMTPVSGVTSLLPYGFVVRNVNNPHSRALPTSPAPQDFEGSVTIAVAFPTQSVATQNPFSISLVYQAVDDQNTRVTQSLEDDNAGGDVTTSARAAALGSTDVAVLGSNHVTSTNSGNPVCSVRTAGTASAPTAYLVNDAGGANLASLPYTSTLSPGGAIDAGFCQPVSTTFSQYVVQGSESGRRTGGSGDYSGTFAVNGDVTSFTPDKPFFTGERVSLSLSHFVAEDYVGGETPSAGFFDEYQGHYQERGSDDIAVADFDGDGIPDVAQLSNSSGYVRVWYGNGDGTVGPDTVVSVGPVGGAPNPVPIALAAGDVNGDGFPDLVVANEDQDSVTVLLRTGPRSFAKQPPITAGIGTGPTDVALADFDNDGKLDLVTANSGSDNISVLYGDGTGGFAGGTLPTSSNVTGDDAVLPYRIGGVGGVPAIAVAGGTSNNVSLYEWRGSRTFAYYDSSATGADPVALTAGDFDGDGRMEVVSANKGGDSITEIPESGAGYGTGTTIGTGAGSAPDGVATIGSNFDGTPNVAVALSGLAEAQIWHGATGSHTLTAGDPVPAERAPSTLVTQDMNGDGVPDLVVDNYGAGDFTIDTAGAGGFGPPQSGGDLATVNPGSAVVADALGDFNHDGRLDIAELTKTSVAVGGGLGGGSFYQEPGITSNVSALVSATDLQTADFDGDGNLDLVAVDPGNGDVAFYRGAGDGTFALRGTKAVPTTAVEAAVGDFNGDGLPDLAITDGTSGQLTVLLNTGNFGFTATTFAVNAGDPSGIDVGDFNSDGHLDLAVTDAGSFTVLTELGDGTGSFTPGPGYGVGATPGEVRVADLNGDGIPDLATVTSSDGAVHVLLSRPGGGYDATAYPLGAASAGLAVGDVNGDGRLDLVAIPTGLERMRVLLGTGTGFAPSPQGPVSIGDYASGKALLLGDFGSHRLSVVFGSTLVPQRAL